MFIDSAATPAYSWFLSYRARARKSFIGGDESTTNAEGRIEIRYLHLGLGHSYTSDPPTGAKRADYVVTTSLGYSLRFRCSEQQSGTNQDC